MRKFLFLFVLYSLLVSAVAFAVSKHVETLSWAQWSAQVDGTNIVALPQFSQILRLFEEDENITVEIHYPDQNNNEGKLWAESLGRWLVTFGIPIRYIVLFPNSGADDQVIITLVDQR